MRWPGQQDDDFFSAFIFAADPLTGRAAVGVGQDHSAGNHLRLFEVIRRHFHAARSEAAFQVRDDFGIRMQVKSERVGYCFASEVVLGWPQATDEDHDVGARKGQSRRTRKVFPAIADDGFKNDFDPELVEPFRQVQRVCILAKRGQQFGADRDDFSVHATSVNESRRGAETEKTKPRIISSSRVGAKA